MSVRRWVSGAAAIVLSASLIAAAAPSRVTYQASSADFANPERGLYHHTSSCDAGAFDENVLRGYRTTENISLVMCIFYLRDYRTSPISAAALTHLQNQLDTVRRAGLKVVLRFAYTDTDDADATPNQVSAHLDQLAPYLQRNADVISVVQAGLIGTWGEWWDTRNFGDEGVISAQNWADRKRVTDKLLSVLPASRAIQLRTPKFKRTMYGTGAVPRIGHHNDCFLASPDDYGTYENPAVEYPYLQQDTRTNPMGGETCVVNPPRSQCPTAVSELSGFHWSYLNVNYNPDVIAGFAAEGCLPDIKRKLGYRLTLTSGTYPSSASRGGPLAISIGLRNDGWAAPYNPRTVRLVLRSNTTGAVTRIPLPADPRTWQPGATTLAQTVTVPSALATGSYRLLLELPDPLLANRPEYSIRLANEGTWEAATGFNNLNATVSIR
ncbi:DUF4832 domain-containing protein [Actinoplanes sp. LDG1-06]|uniref:DUF4832 domain-containing protein n=1 Tax=Paractinoplanes ovalisporus TaxID=2810368 RepID=A0ABS2AFI6_9ACTN|nr:DUF4832 domain-containing protein [Actinoplanes ovalisporus]MBM2618579.1 DUF4832 domain-containing protein [Actinoplanes ovalisporus]